MKKLILGIKERTGSHSYFFFLPGIISTNISKSIIMPIPM